VLVHLTVLWLDPYARLRIFDLLIPFDATYRWFWVGLGTIGMELLVVTVVTSLLRRRIGARLWKLLHWASYALWPIAWLHGWYSGTDAGTGWFRLVAIVCLLAAAGAVAWRCTPRFLEIPRPRSVRPAPAFPSSAPATPPTPGPPAALRGPSGAHRAIRGRTGANPAIFGDPAASSWRSPSASQPVLGSNTGSQPVIRDDQFGPAPPSGRHAQSEPGPSWPTWATGSSERSREDRFG
jgi:sulfoxide reductase heme-binding subunit YedZ